MPRIRGLLDPNRRAFGTRSLLIVVALALLITTSVLQSTEAAQTQTVSAITLTSSTGLNEWNTVPMGGSVTFAGTATNSSGAPISGVTLYLYTYLSGGRVGSPVDSAVTGSDGAFSFSYEFSSAGTYNDFMSPCSSYAYGCVESPFVYTYVSGPVSSIAFSASATSVSAGSTVALVGLARDSNGLGTIGLAVYVFAGPSGGTQSLIDTVTTQAGWGGSFVAYVPYDNVGTFTADASSSSTNAGVNSPIVTITVTTPASPPQYSLSITNPPPSSVTSGTGIVYVYGEVLSTGGSPEGGVSVTVPVIGPTTSGGVVALPQYLVPGTSTSTLSQGVNSQGQTFYYNFYVSYQFSTYATFEFSVQEGSGSTFLQTPMHSSTWSASPPPTYSVTFSETGLAPGTTWSVDFNSVLESSAAATLTFTGVGAGSYSWSTAASVACGTGCQYTPSIVSGTMTVPTQTSQAIGYTTEYQVAMAAGTGGTTSPASGTSTWVDSGGTLAISATASSGYTFTSWTSSTNSITISSAAIPSTTATVDAPGTITANFAILPSVTFTETGLPSGSSWAVTFNGDLYSGTTSSITINGVASGIYSWSTATSVSGETGVQYVPSPTSGSITVGSSSISTSVAYSTQYYLTVTSSSGTASGSGWYGSGTTSTFSVSPTTVAGSTGVQYVFSSWLGSGAGSYTGPSSSESVTMNAPVTETAQWTTQYQVTMGINPSGAGSTTPTGTAWYNAGLQLAISETPDAGYLFSSWSSSNSSNTLVSGTGSSTIATIGGPGSITADFDTLPSVTFTESGLPSGASWSVTFNGNPYSSNTPSITINGVTPGTYSWSTATSVAGGTGVQYIPSTPSGSITVGSSSVSTSIEYSAQYLLTVTSPYGISSGGGWYDSGGVASFSISPTTVAGVTGTQYLFSSWSGSGTGSYSGSGSSGSVTVNAPITETAQWGTQYQVTMAASSGGNTSPALGSSTWVNSGGPLSITGTPETGYAFSSWSSSAGSITFASSTSSSTVATVGAPGTVTANFEALPSVSFTETGLPTGAAWSVTFNGDVYSSTSSSITVTGVSPGTYPWSTAGAVSGSTGVQYVASLPSGSVTVSGSSVSTPISYSTQYYLTVTSSYGTSLGTGWYGSGTTASFSIGPTTVAGSTGMQYVFASWSGSGAGSYAGSSISASVTVNSPITETAQWTTQYQIAMAAGAGGTTSPAVGTYTWINAGGTLAISATPSSGFAFESWSSSSSSVTFASSTSPSTTATIDAPGTILANFAALPSVAFTETGLPSGSSWSVTFNGNLYSGTAPANITIGDVSPGMYSWSTPASISGGTGVQYLPSTSSGSITVGSSPVTTPIAYITQYYLTVTSAYGTASGTGWYGSGASAPFSVSPTTVAGTTATQYIFGSWLGSGTGSYTGPSAATSVTMDTPITESAQWTTQFQVTMAAGAGGTTSPAVGTNTWVDSGGSLTISATANSGYSFSSWTSSTTSITFSSATSSSTAATVDAAGTITANFAAFTAAPITPSGPSIDKGQAIVLTANPSGGTTPYTYQWYTAAACSTPISGATSSSYTAKPSKTTTYYYKVTDSASPKASECSPGNVVAVDPALKAGAITPASPSIVSGNAITLTAHASGGTGPYSYLWYSGTTSAACLKDTTLLGGTSSTETVSPTTNTFYCYRVTDSSGGTPTASVASTADQVKVTKGAVAAQPVASVLPPLGAMALVWFEVRYGIRLED